MGFLRPLRLLAYAGASLFFSVGGGSRWMLAAANASINRNANTAAAKVNANTNAAAALLVLTPPPSIAARDWTPGAVLEGYELVERTALLGVCNHLGPAGGERNDRAQRRRIAGSGESDRKKSKAVVALDETPRRDVAVMEVAVESGGGVFPVVATTGGEDSEDEEDGEKCGIVPEGPSLEYQCLLDDIDLIYVNRNYRLRKKFAAGSHGEVWRATRRHPNANNANHNKDAHESFVLKRLFVERGERMVEMGLREAHFGKRLADEPHVTRFVEFFFRGSSTAPTIDPSQRQHHYQHQRQHEGQHQRHPYKAYTSSPPSSPPPPRPLPAATPASLSADDADSSPPQETLDELWLVFYDEGISLRHYLYATRASAHAAVLFEPSPFWHKLRVDAHGEDVLREILRQLLEGVAALHDRGITHRDIKPSNILVHLQRHEEEGDEGALSAPVVKLADFGSAVDDHTFRHLYGDLGPTQAEETREYQPPEVLFSEFGAPYDYAYPLAYDLWSVGVVFLEIVLGSPQVFMISPRARAKLDAKLKGATDDASRLKSYLLHVLTHEFCIFQPPPHELQRLWTQHALVSDSCHFGRFNTTIIERDPMHTGLRNPWGLDLMWKLLQWNPSQRISARAALDHAFFKGPYICRESRREFATREELRTHEAYLSIQRTREQEMALVVREKYQLPTAFVCPHCRRQFATIASCEQHLVARKHSVAAGTRFCDHDHESMRHAIRHDTLHFANASITNHANANANANVGVALLQGKKKYMEDYVVVYRGDQRNLSVYAVIDGHLGTGAAEYVRTHLTTTLLVGLETMSTLVDDRHVRERMWMRQVFLKLHSGFLDSQPRNSSHDFSGSTLTVVVHFEDEGRILSANVGDSRAIVVTGPESFQVLSTDHWPNEPSERRRIESSGGFITYEGLWRVVGQLAVSRSIGDRHLRQYVTAEPTIFSLDLVDSPGPGLVLVVASDGVWDTMANRDVAHFLSDVRTTGQSLPDAALDLIQEAFLRGSLDNLAAVLVAL